MAAIAGLPRLPDRKLLELDKPPAKRGKSTRSVPALGLRVQFNGRFVSAVVNPKGKRPNVAIVQRGSLPGFTVQLDNPPFTVLGSGFRLARKLAIRLALRGHKLVTIRG